MNATIQRVFSIGIILLGLLTGAAYALVIALSSNRREAGDEWGTLAGFGFFSAAVGVFWLYTTFKRSGSPFPDLRFPPVWLSLVMFAALVGAGFGLQVLDRGTYLGPLLATFAFVAVGALFLQIAARWMPEKRIPIRNIVLPGMWGVFVAPALLMLIQGTAVALLLVGAVIGIFAENPEFEIDPNLEERITNYLESSDSSATSTEVPAIVETPTIALMLFSLVAIIAPLSEELIKAVGAILVLSRRSAITQSDAFHAAVAAGLGFALFEGIGYTIAAPSSWHQLILIRAPVVIMHVAATSIVVIGWYRMRQTGRGFIPYFAVGVALHAGWNALAVGFIYSLAGMDAGADPSTAQALSILAVVLLLGTLLITAFVWFISIARKAGAREHQSFQGPELDHGLSISRSLRPSGTGSPAAQI
ncbi:hypothetical protein BH23CHL2_BH23CHL2_13280 [soil metagenome]